MHLAKNARYFGIIIIFLVLVNGCASKQSSPTRAELPDFVPPEANSGNLSPEEMKALQVEGQIDSNIPVHAMEDVAKHYRYYLREGRGTMCALSKRSEPYLSYARDVFKKRGMPEELANLAIVESGFRPDAVSAAGAAGAWQFMPATGIKYGLAQDAWTDERLDPYKATEAAADYLQKLHEYFGDWPTAIAAYNAGEGKMSRAKTQAEAKDFYEVKAKNDSLDEKTRLRDETKQYVPRFLAITKIMRNLPQLGFEPIQPQEAEPVARLTAAPGTDLNGLSRACNLSWNEFTLYNPHHKHAITCTSRQTFVYVPGKREQLAARYLNSGGSGQFSGWRLAQAGQRDTLEKIAKKSNVSVALLKAANPNFCQLKAKQQLILVPPAAKLASQPQKRGNSHKIQANETFYSIAKKYDVDVEELMRYNGLKNPRELRNGCVLKIPSKKVVMASSGSIGKKKSYTVQPKDNFWRISRKFNVSVNDLRRWNGIDEKSLKPGAQLIVSGE